MHNRTAAVVLIAMSLLIFIGLWIGGWIAFKVPFWEWILCTIFSFGFAILIVAAVIALVIGLAMLSGEKPPWRK